MLNLFDYASELLKLNKEPLQTWDRQRLYSSFAFGLVEELLEFTEVIANPSNPIDKQVKEAGDVLAYVVLLSAAHGLTPEQIAEEYQIHTESFDSTLTAASTLAGLFKRLWRENQSVPVAAAFFSLNTVLSELAPHAPHEITLANIAEVNLKKLKDRANRGQLFQGTGSDR